MYLWIASHIGIQHCYHTSLAFLLSESVIGDNGLRGNVGGYRTTNQNVSYPVLVLQQVCDWVIHVQDPALIVLHVMDPDHILQMLSLHQK